MNRLTIKDNIGIAKYKPKFSKTGMQSQVDMLNKLGQIEDIEEEIGFTIPALFKGLTLVENMGVVIFKYKGKSYEIRELENE